MAERLASRKAAADAAQDLTRQQQAAARQALPSIITVQVLGFGSEPMNGGVAPAPAPTSAPATPQVSNGRYDEHNPLQLVGFNKNFDPQQLARSTDEERQHVLHDQ